MGEQSTDRPKTEADEQGTVVMSAAEKTIEDQDNVRERLTEVANGALASIREVFASALSVGMQINDVRRIIKSIEGTDIQGVLRTVLEMSHEVDVDEKASANSPMAQPAAIETMDNFREIVTHISTAGGTQATKLNLYEQAINRAFNGGIAPDLIRRAYPSTARLAMNAEVLKALREVERKRQ
jgi:hypothetical protein